MATCADFLLFVADSLGRRLSLLWTSIAQDTAMLYIGLYGPVCWIYVSEIPTARLRSLNVAIAAATQWLFNFVVERATPNMLASAGSHGYGAFIIYSCLCLSLEKMDDLFGVTALAKERTVEHGNDHAQPAATEIGLDGKLTKRMSSEKNVVMFSEHAEKKV
ncbi:hypothetical protein GQ43DRAFT_483269 [Delitschia confertaspora ATCC 74209]|uniref:Major facilitator superfamily (MFS) profile domain-containing protein n=1 Tax=Delitschia confertaspora ATCC 74209 TaxID=1513339 RepID=A0A9P4JHQ4_9PLEO|nr:hypothetical protein GQ43DRAFT_483269 [Delitschia confertaspora ATCC 74209]